ncbi:MAG: alpha/beta hydrolase [Clostridiales bacterium]|nr:alpha/beta hydrolase [Clostridiales bacterium]
MEPIQFPEFMNEENMRKMPRQQLIDMFKEMGGMMMPPGMVMPDPETLTVKGERMMVPTRDGDIRCIIYRAKKENMPVYFGMHGGGFVGGNCEDIDFFCDMINKHLDINVVNINYRKAPEFPYPYAVNDVFDAVSWFHTNAAQFGIDTDRMAIGGHSAGGNLAAVTSLRSVKENTPFRFKVQILDYPPIDLTKCAFDKFIHPMGIPPQIAIMFDACYISPEDGDKPTVSPVTLDPSELTGQPPTVILTAEYDSLRDEAEAYALKLIAAGVPVWCRRFLGSAHGFTMTLGGNDMMGMPEDINAEAGCKMMIDALRYYLVS